MITVKATASILSDPAKTKTATYKFTVLGDFVEPHEVKAIKANQWDVFTEDYYCNLKYDEEEGSCYFEGSSDANLATDSKDACVRFLINSDGSTFDASVYNTLTIRLKCDATEGASHATSTYLRVYSESDTGYADQNKKSIYGGGDTRDRIWRIPMSELASKGISLTDMKALSLEGTSGAALKIYSITFENLSDYEPYTVTISQKDRYKQVKEKRSIPLTATAQNSSKKELDNINFIWSSSDDSIATVSDDGIVTGVSAGEVVISAAAAGSKAQAFYNITVYDDTPVKSGFQIGTEDHVYTYTGSDSNNRMTFSVDELSAANGGLELKAINLDAGGEPVGGESTAEITATITSQSTSDRYYKISPVYEDGVLTATVEESGNEKNKYTFFSLKVTIDGENMGTMSIRVYKNVCRIPLTSTTMYNASAGKQKDDIRISDGCAVIATSSDVISGIGFKYMLPEGETLDNYTEVQFFVGGTDDDYDLLLYMPSDGWDTEAITCTEGDSKLASNSKDNCSDGWGSTYDVYFPLSLSEEEKNTNLVHFAVGFGEGCTGDLSIVKNEIILVG